MNLMKNKSNIIMGSLFKAKNIRNLEVDRCPSKENLFGQSTLLMKVSKLFFPKVIYGIYKFYKFIE